MSAGRALVVCLAAAFAATAQADDEELRRTVEMLKAQVQQLAGRVQDLESQLQHRETAPARGSAGIAGGGALAADTAAKAAPSQSVPVGDIKGSYKIPGTDTSLALGGFIKLDAIYNSVSVGGAGGSNAGDQQLTPGSIPLSGQGEHSQVTFHGRSSRVWLKAFTPTRFGDLNSYVEMDFFATQAPGEERSTNTYTPSLRHAYGSLGRFLAGQTWTTFLNVNSLPETNDVGGPVGRIYNRQPMIRWTQPFDGGDWQVALESPETTLTGADGSRITLDDDRYPDLIGKLGWRGDWGDVSVAALGRRITQSRGCLGAASKAACNAPVDSTASAWGGAVSVAGRVRTIGLDNLRFMLNYGNVLGRYTSLNLFNDGVLLGDGRIDLIPSYGGFVAYQHWWNEQWRSSLAYGAAYADYAGNAPANANRRAQSVHANLLWSPMLQTTFGLEYIYADRVIESGREGVLQRLQFSAQYNF